MTCHNLRFADATLKAFCSIGGVGVAYDSAFCFYYPDNLTLLKEAGGELIKFSPIKDTVLPEVDLVYLGGGYPEIYADVLQRNSTMRRSIQSFAARGGVVYAECGGLIYLARTLMELCTTWSG